MILFDKINIKTLDFEFSGRSFKNELITEMNNAVSKFKNHTVSNGIDSANLIGVLCGFELSKTDRDCGGCCDIDNKTISINEDKHAIILHEVSHALQLRAGAFDFEQRQISDAIKIEQQAETMAYLLNLKLFNVNRPQDFSCYFERKDWIFLKDWFGDYFQNDLEL